MLQLQLNQSSHLVIFIFLNTKCAIIISYKQMFNNESNLKPHFSSKMLALAVTCHILWPLFFVFGACAEIPLINFNKIQITEDHI